MPSTVAGSYTNLIFWIMDLVVKNINICLVFLCVCFWFFPDCQELHKHFILLYVCPDVLLIK